MLLRRAPVLLALPVLVLAGCTTAVGGHGIASASHPSAGRTTSVSASSSAAPSPSPTPTSATDAAYDLVLRTKNGMHVGDPVAVKASVSDDNADYTVDARYGSDPAGDEIAHATIVISATTVEIRTIGHETWMQAPTAYWDLLDVAGAPTIRGDQWVVITQPDTWPAYYGTPVGLDLITTPPGADRLGPLTATTFAGHAASTVTDQDGRAYTIVDGEPPHVVQVRGTGGDADLTYPTDAFTVERPAAASVITVQGI